ncbi:30S ribosomal S1 domain protein [Rickettsia hoogstraalii str. RCCE3]|nr:30S ribosomal S1 domain protein [Rickettsia hoogstraalii str. RCCE3]
MIHEGDISWEDKDLLKSYKKGDKIECKVLAINIEKEQVSLGINNCRLIHIKKSVTNIKRHNS